MGLVVKVTRPQIEAALKAVKGNVKEASIVLGIARKNLYNRMASLGIDPDFYRGDVTPSVTGTDGVTQDKAPRVTQPSDSGRAGGSVSVFSRKTDDTLSRRRGARRLHGMPSAAVDEAPVETGKKLRQARTLYLAPEIWREIDDACFDLAAALREKMSPSKVTEKFFTDDFRPWVARIKGQSSSAAPSRSSKRKPAGEGNR